MDDSTVSTMLRDLADAPAPPSSVDVRRATVTGRRRIRARRIISGGSAAAALTAVVAVVAPLTTGTPAPREPSLSMPAVAPSHFDPFVQYAAFGWLPEGALGMDLGINRDWLRLGAYYAPDGHPDGGSVVRLWMATAGRDIDHFVSRPTDPTAYEQTRVHDRPAWWWEAEGGTVVRWEYAPRAWAAVEVSVPGADRDSARGLAERVAADVRYGVDDPVELPFVTEGVPAPFVVTEVGMNRQDDVWSAQVTYDDGDPANGDWALTIAAFPSAKMAGNGEPNTTVDGHPALMVTNGDGGSWLTVFNVDGVHAEFVTNGTPFTAMLPGGLEGVFRATEFYADPADWR
jgi:hypothetical protein